MNQITQSSINQALAQSLVDAMPYGGALGALAIGAIFGSDSSEPPSYFTEVYEEIAKIVKSEIEANQMELLNGQINGVVSFINDTYVSLANDTRRSPQELSDAISPRVSVLETVISTLQMESFALMGFPAFLTAANLQLALYQELAIRDPMHQGDPMNSPFDSGYAGATGNHGAAFADYAAETWPQVIQARQNAVVLQDIDNKTTGSRGWETYHQHTYYWEDTATGEEGTHFAGEKDEPDDWAAKKSQAMIEYNERINAVTEKLKADLGDPDTITANWRKLKSVPLPICVAQINSFLGSTTSSRKAMDLTSTFTVSWRVSNAVSVTLNGTSTSPSGSKSYTWTEREGFVENCTGNPPPVSFTLVVTDKRGAQASSTIAG
jgi:hypothetical protein